MEKPPAVVKAKNKFLSFLPKAAKAAAAMRFEFENPPFSPGNKDKKRASLNAGNHKHKPHQMRGGFSGPITSVILEEARNKSKSSRFEMKEPTSPKISCMGQIKHKKKIVKEQKINNNDNYKPFSSLPRDQSRKKSSSVFKNIMVTSSDVKKKEAKNHVNPRNFFSGKTKPEGRKSDASAEISRLPDRAPSLSQMKRFASSRDTLSKFDWTTAQVAPEESVNNHRRYYSDEERDYSDEEEEEEEEFIIPFSAPLGVGGAGAGVALEPRKEINLWKRTMAKPKPLQLTTSW